jgi:hypothetical protein
MSPKQVQNRLKNPQKLSGKRAHRAQAVWSLLVAAAVALVALQQVVRTHNNPMRSIAATATLANPDNSLTLTSPHQ